MKGKNPLEKRQLRYQHAASLLDRFDWLRVQIEDAIEQKKSSQAVQAMEELKQRDYLQEATQAYDEADELYNTEVNAAKVENKKAIGKDIPAAPDTIEELHAIDAAYSSPQGTNEIPTGTFDQPTTPSNLERKSPTTNRRLKGSGVPIPSEAMVKAAQEREEEQKLRETNQLKKNIFGRATSWFKRTIGW